MKIFRARYDNVSESPLRTLYGRKGTVLFVPLDVCILQLVSGKEEFRPPLEASQLIAAPIQELDDGRLGVIAQYEWPPRTDAPVNPVVTVQLAPSANIKDVPDLRVLASQIKVGDNVFLTDTDVAIHVVKTPEEKVLESRERSVSKAKIDDGLPLAGRRIDGVVVMLSHWCAYPDLTHRLMAYSVEFHQHIDRTVHGAAVRLATGALVGMLISTQNQPDGVCRALVYSA